MTKETTRGIARGTALALCREIQEEQQGKWWRWAAWWCWGCRKASGGEPAKMCWHNHPAFRGCAQVNALYDTRVVRRGAREVEDPR